MSEEVFFKTGYNHDRDAESIASGLKCEDESLAIQSQRDEADINVIVKRFGVTGQIPVIPRPPSLDEFGEIFDFQSAMEVMARARESFAALDADVRARFANDPHAFVLFCEDPANLPELRKMGLAVPEASAPAPVKPA